MENTELYVVGLVGVVLHLLKNLLVARRASKSIDRIAEAYSFLISSIIVGLLVFAKKDIEGLYPLTLVTTSILGYSAQSVFKFLVDHYLPKENKKIRL